MISRDDLLTAANALLAARIERYRGFPAITMPIVIVVGGVLSFYTYESEVMQ